MKNLKLKGLDLDVKQLTRNEMKNILGSGGPIGPIHICFKCCPSDPCSPVRHYCTDKLCPE